MKLVSRLAAIFVLSGTLCIASAVAASAKSVVVTNNTSYTMTEFYASASTSPNWSATNIFAGQSLAPGQQTTITINDGTGNCTYDLMAVLYGATQYAYDYQVNTCGGASWTIQQ